MWAFDAHARYTITQTPASYVQLESAKASFRTMQVKGVNSGSFVLHCLTR